MAANDADWTLGNTADSEQAASAGDLRLLQPGLLQRMESIGSRSSVNSTGNSSLGAGSGSQRASYNGQTQAWWSVDEHMKPRGVQMFSSHQRMGMSLAARIFQQCEDTWDLSDSLADLYLEHDVINKKSWSDLAKFKPPSSLDDIDKNKWLAADTSHGFIQVYPPDSTSVSEVGARIIPCSLAMEAHSICQALGLPPNSLHIQFGGDVTRRLDPYEHPLVLQNEYLSKIGFHDVYRIQKEGLSVELGYLIRFYSGKPFFDSTYSKNHLSAYLDVKLGGVLARWSKRLCTLSGTQLKIYKDKNESSTAQVVQLCNGSVEECRSKTHPHHIKLSTQSSGPEKIIFLSFETFTDYSKWLKKCRKAVAKLPSNADLSNCNLEFLPETLFVNGQLSMLNLRHNALRNRPTQEDIYTIGWLEDLPRFQCLRSLNLADNNLTAFPQSICEMQSLVELNLASNKIGTLPAEIGNLTSLQALHLHNNHLTSIPNEILLLKKLVILVLAFNKFHNIPSCVAQLTDVRTSECETIIMAGNLVENITPDITAKLKYAKKIDLRMNNLTLPASETVHMSVMDQLTHIDLRMNNIKELDLKCIKSLEYINVEHNQLHTLQLTGNQLKTVFASHNDLQQFLVTPKPDWLEIIDVSFNRLEKLPEWMADCSFLKRLNASHNKLQTLPSRLFCDAQRLKQLIADHNEIRELPDQITNSVVEEINVHHNFIESLPDEFLAKLNKLKILNLSSNALTHLPPLNEINDLNKVQELYLTQNSLHDDCLDIISGFRRLKILHLAYNELTHIDDKFVHSLDMLQELNLSGNRLRSLPKTLVNMPELRLLRAHSNLLKNLPNLSDSSTLKVLDVACNKLLSVSASELASSTQLQSLDMQMTQFSIDKAQMEMAKKTKSIRSIDSSGENRELYSSASLPHPHHKLPRVCQLGFAETSGSRNKLCISVIHQLAFKGRDEALFAMFDGGRNSEVPKILKKSFTNILSKEMEESTKPNIYLKYTFLQSHKTLKNAGQYLGASALVCQIKQDDSSAKRFYINVANCGDIVAVLCRAGEPLLLSRSHTIVDDREEAFRIFRADGIITEDNRVNGTSTTSRALGNCYMYPHVIPEPYIIKKSLRPEDQFLIIANSSLWRYLSHKEAIEEIQYIANPVVAAKRLQDLAQGYGCKENVSVLVIQFNCSLLSAAPSVSSVAASSESVAVTDSNKNLDTIQRKKRPIPAPRSNLPRAGDSQNSLTSNMRATVDLSYINIPEQYSDWSVDSQQNLELRKTLETRLSQVKEKELEAFLKMGVPLEGLSLQSLTDSTSTLTDQSNDEFDKYQREQAKLPLYSSDTRLMDFHDSNSTLNVDDDGVPTLGMSSKSNPLYQSDTRLLHASQIELRSTNYFNRPPLSCSSLEEEHYRDDDDDDDDDEVDEEEEHSLFYPPKSAQSRRHRIEMSNEELCSPDGSYFSIDSVDNGDDGEDDLYQNVAVLREQMLNSSRMSSSSSLARKGTVYENYTRRSIDDKLANNPILDRPAVTSNISLLHSDGLNIDTQPNLHHHHRLKPRTPLNNNIHVSNGSSAYGSGSLATSQDSSMDTYL